VTRQFYDLLVALEALAGGALSRARELGFRGVGAAVAVSQLMHAPQRFLDLMVEVRKRGEEEGVDVVTRLVIDVALREGRVKALLRRWRRKFEVISAHSVDRRLTAFACRDSRIDVVTMVPGTELMRGDFMYIRTLEKRIELLLAPLHEGGLRRRAEVLAEYAALVDLLKRKGLTNRLIFSSGANNLHTLRDPRSMAALLHVLGLGYEEALNALSINPASLVKENRDKLAGVVPVRGVRVLGEDEEVGEE